MKGEEKKKKNIKKIEKKEKKKKKKKKKNVSGGREKGSWKEAKFISRRQSRGPKGRGGA